MDGGPKDLITNQDEIVKTSYKGVEFAVVHGDILERLQHVDAMVIPSSPQLDLQGGAIENAVYDKYGEGPFEAVNIKKKQIGNDDDIQMGEAVGVEYQNKTFVFVNIQPNGDSYKQTPEVVETSAMSCFAEASNLNCKSIVMPALGNGMWSVPLPISTGAIANAAKLYIDTMEQQGLPQNLKRIEIILYKPSTVDQKSIVAPVMALTA